MPKLERYWGAASTALVPLGCLVAVRLVPGEAGVADASAPGVVDPAVHYQGVADHVVTARRGQVDRGGRHVLLPADAFGRYVLRHF